MRRRHCMGDRNVIGHNITRIRCEKNISQGQLVAHIQLLGIEMNQAKLSRIEGRRIAIIDKDMIAIAQALGVSLDELCDVRKK